MTHEKHYDVESEFMTDYKKTILHVGESCVSVAPPFKVVDSLAFDSSHLFSRCDNDYSVKYIAM